MQFSLIVALKKNFHSLLILSAITLCAYIFSLNNSFVWDDEQFIYNNVYVKNFAVTKIFTENTIAGAGEISTYYRPLTTLSFAVDHATWGLNPVGFHITNTILHLCAGIFLFLYLKTMRFSQVSSLTIASIFLVHPLQTEAVVYANSRGDSLYAFWTLAALLTFALLLNKKLPYIQIYDLKISLGKNTLLLLTVVSYLFSIFGKEIGIASLGLLGLAFLFVQLQNKTGVTIRKIFQNIPGVTTIALLILAMIGYLFFRTSILAIPTTQNMYFAGTAYGESIFVRLHTFTQALWKYFQLILFPYPLHMERTLEILEQPISFWLVATVALSIGIFVLAVREYKKQRTVYIAFGSLWFLGMLVPVSGIIPVNGLIYEHWLYVPIVGFCIAVYGIKYTLVPKKFQKKINHVLKSSIPIILFIFICLTIRQNYIWGTPIRFYTYTVQFSDSARLNNNLAMAYADAQDYENAIAHYKRAIELGDYYPQTHHNLGNTYLAIGEIDLAKQEFNAAIKMNENFMPSYFILIEIFAQEKNYEAVTPFIDKLLESFPDNLELQYYKAQNLLDTGKTQEGRVLLELILQNPEITTPLKILVNDKLRTQ